MVMSLSAIAVVTGRFPQPDRDAADVSDIAGARIARAAWTGAGSRFPTPSFRAANSAMAKRAGWGSCDSAQVAPPRSQWAALHRTDPPGGWGLAGFWPL